MIIALDTETTGLDPYHGSKPYFVTLCDEDQNQIHWEWDVDPLTREPLPKKKDLKEIQTEIDQADKIVFHNALFDLKMLDTLSGDGVFKKNWQWKDWPWEKVYECTLLAHMLASCQRRDLTTLSLIHLGVNLQPYEDDIAEATDKARRICRSKSFQSEHGEWAIAKGARDDMPSAGGTKLWKQDVWLLRAMIKHAPDFVPEFEEYKTPEDHPWSYLLAEYANSDSAATVALFEVLIDLIKEKGLESIYEERRKCLSVTYKMKEFGVSINKARKDELYEEYLETSDNIHQECLEIADSPDLKKLPVNGRSNALDKVIFEHFGLPPFRKSKKTGKPSMNKGTIDHWLKTIDPEEDSYKFVEGLKQYRQRKTAMSYMAGYERFWLPNIPNSDWFVLHPSLNPTGTNTLRWSSSNPNEQNISKKEGFNLRYCFGPSPKRLWASFDFNNIELRIPAYESGEEIMVEIFEKPQDAPYFGSYHLVNASIVFPDQFWPLADEEGAFKKHHPELYKKIKNFGFAVSYGAVMRSDGSGTADRACGVKGAHKKVLEKLQKHSSLNQHWISVANETGYVETIPDKSVDAEKGYPIQCSRTKWDRISPTVPLNYHVQGTACWVIFRSMLKVQEYLDKLNEGKPKEKHWFMCMQVHDELVLDFPKQAGYKNHLKNIAKIMEKVGEYIDVPLTVGCELHRVSWDVSEDIIF